MAASTFFAGNESKGVENQNNENKTDNNLGQIRLYLDFDGTLSGRKGSDCVSSPLYNSLLKYRERYDRAEFLDEKVMVEKLKAGFEKSENKTMQLAEGSLEFLNEMLAKGAELTIISRNRREYVRANLLTAGMSPENLAKITIRDVKNLGFGKHGVVISEERNAKTKATVVVVCDDDKNDYNEMTRALKDSKSEATLVSRSELPGKFKWAEIAKEVYEKAALTVTITTGAKLG